MFFSIPLNSSFSIFLWKFSREPAKFDGRLTINQFIPLRRGQETFVGMCQGLDLCFSPAGGTPGMAGFQIQDLFRSASTEILCTPACCVLSQASGQICGYSRVQGIVRTKYNIDLPVHRYRRVLFPVGRTGVSRFMAYPFEMVTESGQSTLHTPGSASHMVKAFLTSLSTHEKICCSVSREEARVCPATLTSWNPRLSYAA